jgi:hypothetical protein
MAKKSMKWSLDTFYANGKEEYEMDDDTANDEEDSNNDYHEGGGDESNLESSKEEELDKLCSATGFFSQMPLLLTMKMTAKRWLKCNLYSNNLKFFLYLVTYLAVRH